MNVTQEIDKKLDVLTVGSYSFNDDLGEITQFVMEKNNEYITYHYCMRVYKRFGESELVSVASLLTIQNEIEFEKLVERVKQSKKDRNIPPQPNSLF